jgi:hypothetical protein
MSGDHQFGLSKQTLMRLNAQSVNISVVKKTNGSHDDLVWGMKVVQITLHTWQDMQRIWLMQC